MKSHYLEVTYRKGKPFAAYLHLGHDAGARCDASRKIAPGLVADYGTDGRPVGLEIVSPTAVSLADIKAAIRKLRISPVSDAELAPLKAA